MKRNKVSSSVASGGRVKVDRAETYPGGSNETAGADGAQKTDYRRYNSSARVSSTGSGNNVMKWFKYITDAAESYKSKDSAKSKKPIQSPTGETPTPEGRGGGGGGVGGGGGSTLYETAKSVANGSRRQENGDGGEDRQAEAEAAAGYIFRQQQQQQQPAGHAWRRVEALQFEEEPVLVQPDEVKVSLTQVVDRHRDTTTPVSPTDMIKEKNRMIEVMLIEKKNLVANILQIPFQSYDHICEVVDETKNTSDVRELMLSSLTQADLLTELINERLDANLVVHEDQSSLLAKEQGRSSASRGRDDPRGELTSDTGGSLRSPTRAALSRSVAIDQSPATGGQQLEEEGLGLRSCPYHQPTLRASDYELPVVVPCSRLMAISSRLRSNLTQLMELVESRDREMASWETELSQCNDHLLQLTSLGHRVGATSEAEESEDVEGSAGRPGEYVTSTWEVAPLRTEHLEVIEAEQIIEPERVIRMAPSLLQSSATITKNPAIQVVMPSANDTSRNDS